MFLTPLCINKTLLPISYIEGSRVREINRITSLGCGKEAINTKQGVLYVCTKNNYRLVVLKKKIVYL